MSLAALGAALACSLMIVLSAPPLQAQATRAHDAARSATDDQEARDLFRLGKQAFDEGRFERALKYFKDAYDLSHRPGLLSNIGTVLDRLRRDQEALEAYKSYLAQVPTAENRPLIEERVRIIESAMRKPDDAQSTQPEPPRLAVAPSPAQAANAEAPRNPASNLLTQPSSNPKSARSSSITSRWWFWAGIGTVAAAAVVVGVAASSGGGTATQAPALSDLATRVREL